MAGPAALGVPAEREVRQVRAGERDGAGLTQPGDHRRVGRGDLLGQGGDAPGRGRAGHVDVLLDGERHAGQRPERLAGGDRPVDRGGGGAGLVGQRHGHRVEVRVDLLDAGQMGLDHLGRRDLAGGDHPGQLSGALAVQLVHRALLSYVVDE